MLIGLGEVMGFVMKDFEDVVGGFMVGFKN